MARWKPKVGEKYYFIDIFDMSFYYWKDDKYHNMYYNRGNCFKTEKDAEKALEKVKKLLLSLHGEVKPKGTRKDYIDVLKHYVCTGAKGVKLETLVKVIELMDKDVRELENA